MNIEYTGRQIAVTQKYKDQAQEGLQRIEKLVDPAAKAKVVLTRDKYRNIADVTVNQGNQSMVAASESTDVMTALREALAKIEQQAVKQKQKFHTVKRHPRPMESVKLAGESLSSSATA